MKNEAAFETLKLIYRLEHRYLSYRKTKQKVNNLGDQQEVFTDLEGVRPMFIEPKKAEDRENKKVQKSTLDMFYEALEGLD